MKSHVSMEQHQCFICGTLYDTGAILLDRSLRQSMERHTVTGTGLCPEHQQLADDGYIALIVVQPDGKTRTGGLVHLRREFAEQIFGQEMPKDIAYIDQEVFDHLQQLAAQVQ